MVQVSDDEFEQEGAQQRVVQHVIPKATYGQYGVDEDVKTFQAPTILIAHAKTTPT